MIEFTQQERESTLWQKLRTYSEARIAELRMSNDSETLDPVKTAAIRGQIKEAKLFASLGDEKPEFKSAGSKSKSSLS